MKTLLQYKIKDPGLLLEVVGQEGYPNAMTTLSKICWVCGVLVLLVVGPPIVGRILIPNYAGSASVERQFSSQIRRLAEIASDPKRQWNISVEGCEADKRLFSDPAILEASVEPTPGYHLIVGDRRLDWSSDMSLPSGFATKIHMARHWFTTTNRSRVSAVSYESQLVDSGGRTVAFTLIVDIRQLRR